MLTNVVFLSILAKRRVLNMLTNVGF